VGRRSGQVGLKEIGELKEENIKFRFRKISK
jgi:hypothetical protein